MFAEHNHKNYSMDNFVSRKRRKLSSSPTPDSHEEEDSTDYKLAILSSMHPEVEQLVLLDVLLAHDGLVEKATNSLLLNRTSSSLRKQSVIGYQSSLKDFLATTSSEGVEERKRPKLMSKKGKTLHLYSPEDVALHTPCSIIHNFLSTNEADELLLQMLSEAETFERGVTFKLFDNVVSSPHTSCLYVDGLEDQKKQQTEYVYNGAVMTDVRLMTGTLLSIKDKVQQAVNDEIEARIKSHHDGSRPKYQSPDIWAPNAAGVNCYNGPHQSLGYHCDQMTYLGPKAIIGSLSLGVAREFRIRRVVPKDDSNIMNDGDADLGGQISVHLPHNSLLVMHAGMQEEWKHSVAPAHSLDPHPISKNRRINITYRHYKANMHPTFTPKCQCGFGAVLRVVQKRKENFGKYFWHCYRGTVPGHKACDFFEWARFSDEGEPIWKK